MFDLPHRIDPVGCDCLDCITGWSRPFNSYGDTEQFHALLHDDIQDATGDYRTCSWMETAAEYCPRRFASWIAEEFRARRLLSRRKLRAKVATTVLDSLLDD